MNKYAKEYILIKMHNIIKKYGHYTTFRGFYRASESLRLIKYLKALKDDESHITFKLKQAINFLVLDLYPKDSEQFSLSVDKTILKIQKPITEVGKERVATDSSILTIPTIELIPPSFLKMDIEFSDKDDKFSYLSSGEKQKIYASSTLIYHLKNLESSLKNAEKKDQPFENLIRYKHINVIFDEIELYYHPDLQRRFLHDLLSNIRKARIENIASLNLIFVTHSPFILSDISRNRILYLDLVEGKSVPKSIPERTFGANIHDLLANSFFLKKEGYMGEFAKTVIKEALNFLKGVKTETTSIRWSKESVRALIDMIGEPLIYRSMNELYSDLFLKTNSLIDEEIKRLEQLNRRQNYDCD